MLKQRLVGAAVIIALAVVLIPMILDSAGKHLVPNVPQEPNYLKTHTRQNLSTRSQKLADLRNIDSRTAVVVKVPGTKPVISKPHSVKPVSSRPLSSDKTRRPPSVAKAGIKRQDKTSSTRDHKSQQAKRKAKVKKPIAVARVSVSESRRKQPKPGMTLDSGNRKPTRHVRASSKNWSVQIASFRNRDNARVLKRKLSRAGFKAYIQRSSAGGSRSVYRVRIGPENSRSNARAMLSKLRQKVRLNGFITAHK